MSYKAGTVTTNATGLASVAFGTAFGDTNYVIELTPQTPGDTTSCMYANKAAGGFDVITEDDGGKAEPGVTVDWFCIAFNDP